jgi:TorA maturation chaperone TorD
MEEERSILRKLEQETSWPGGLAPEHVARLRCYALLARAMQRPLDPSDSSDWLEVLGTLADSSRSQERARADLGPAARQLAAEIMHLGRDDTAWDGVRRQYLRLFVGPYHVPAPPYESVYSTPQRLVMQEPATEVRRAYAEAGFTVRRRDEVPDDHLACELEFAGLLLARALLAGVADPALKAQSWESYLAFLTSHPLRWVPDLCRDIQAAKPGEFFEAFCGFLHSFLRSEAAGSPERALDITSAPTST